MLFWCEEKKFLKMLILKPLTLQKLGAQHIDRFSSILEHCMYEGLVEMCWQFFSHSAFLKGFFFRRTTHPSIPNRRFLKRHLLGGAIPFSRDSYIKIFSLRENVIKPLNASFAERKIRIFYSFSEAYFSSFFFKIKI